MFGTSHPLTGFSEESCIFKLTVRNFRLILSWELKNASIVPTHYTLKSTIMSIPEDPKAIEHCTNVTTSFCDVTDVWKNMHETYVPLLDGFRGNATLLHCADSFLASNFSFEPPEFGIVGFTDHINVTVTFPPVVPKIYGKSISQHAALVIQAHSKGIMTTKKNQINRDISGNFSYVIDNLIPNTNYCISVYFKPEHAEQVIKSPLKCTLLPPIQESGLSDTGKVQVLTSVVFLAAVFVSTGIVLRRAGYICLKNKLPKVLNFHNFFARGFSELPPLEAMDVVEVILVHRKKKVWNYNYEEDSDSDMTELTPKPNAAGYTMHGLLGRLGSQAPASPTPPQELRDSDAEASDGAEAPDAAGAGSEPDPPPGPEPQPRQSGDSRQPYERRESLPQDPCPEDSGSSHGGSGDRVIFNVDLNSVFLRVVDKDVEEASLASSLAEDMVDLEEEADGASSVLAASGENRHGAQPSPASPCPWTEDAPSDQSDADDADIQDGYIMR